HGLDCLFDRDLDRKPVSTPGSSPGQAFSESCSRKVGMTLRPPRMNSSKVRESALDYEIAQEQAAALGRLGRALEAALAALPEHDGVHAHSGDRPGQAPAGARDRLLRDASNALWCFVVQREAV